MIPKDWQMKATEAWIKNNCKGTVKAPTGTGKTYLAVYIIKKVLPKYVVVIVPTIALKEQWETQFKEFNIIADVFVINTVIKAPEYFKNYSLIILDECLSGGTKIITKKGQISIGEIVNKKMKLDVLTYNLKNKKYEYNPITGYFKTRDKRKRYKITLRNKKNGQIKVIRCTKEHKWFTGKKYTPTMFLKEGDVLYHRDYVCPICNKIMTEKGLGGHYNVVHLNKNEDRSKEIIEKQSRTMKNNFKKGLIKNNFLYVGNGKGMSRLEKFCYDKFLNKDWIYNLPLFGWGRIDNYPTSYKIDFYNKKLKVGLEIDSKMHDSKKQKLIDEKKTLFLKNKGYNIIRLDENTIRTLRNKGDFKKWMNGKL